MISNVHLMKLFSLAIVLQILECQTNFNYVNDGNFQNNNCTSAQLSSQYSCLLPIDNSLNWNSGDSNKINLEYGYKFYSTNSSSIVASLDYYGGASYVQNKIYMLMHPITQGTYRLTLTAYTRKTGTASDFYFSVSLYDLYNYTSYINNKTYQFTSLGTMSINETITISSPPYSNAVYLYLYPKNISSFSIPWAVGISDVKFQKTSCNSNETSIVLVTGEIACIENYVIQSVNYCSSWNYYHSYYPSGAYYAVYKFYSCSSCSSGKLVGVYDDTKDTSFRYNYNKYGCTINQIPNVSWYRKLTIQDQNGKYFYKPLFCNLSSVGSLIIPNVSFSGYDSSSYTCGISSDSAVSYWQVANSTYYPAICSATGYFPVITSSTSRVCQYISSPITNCKIYLADFKCASCGSDTVSITVNNSGTLTSLCLTNSLQIFNCITYVLVSSAYVCSTCNTGYTLSILNSVAVCMRNDMIDGNCTTYALNANKNYECTVCTTGFTLSTVNTTLGQIKRCLSTTTQIIRDCLVYENITGVYSCYQCSATANIARYLFTYNSVSAYRCLNSVTEYLAKCETYDFVSSLYKCSVCSTNYVFINVTINSALQLKCLATSTQVVSNCMAYGVDASNNYICSSCATGYTLKTVSGFPKCLPNAVIDPYCTTYILNGSNFECSVCNSLYTVSSVYTASVTYKYCLLATALIRDCSVYESISGGGYQCNQCQSQLNIARYTFLMNGVQAYRCLNTASEYVSSCSTYQLASQIYTCTACSTGYEMKNIMVNSVSQPRCLNSLVQIVSSCTSYVTDPTNGYVCSSCSSSYTLKTVSNIPKCISDVFIDAQCTTYILNGSNFECSTCNSLYNVSSVYRTLATYKYCLSTSNQVIRDCQVYEDLAGVYQCKQCSSQSNIGRYSFMLNSITMYRCLKTDSEYADHCTLYSYANQVYSCTQCSSNYETKKVTINSVALAKCLSTSTEVIQHCAGYIISLSSTYECIQCDSGFTLKPVSGIYKCLPDKVIDPQCTTYILNGNSFECSQCNSLYSLQNVFKNVETFRNCLLTNTEVIRDCDVYQINSQKYECKQCSSTQNIARYSFTFDGYQTHRCLNSLTEYVEFCVTYQLSSQIYTCTLCETAYQRSDATVNQAEKVKCLTKANEVVQDCKHYVFDSVSSTYSCDQCDNGFTLKTDSGRNICVHDGQVQDNCIQYKDDGPIEVCTKCQTLFQLGTVSLNGNSVMKCLSKSSQIVAGCKTYQEIGGVFDCIECNSEYSKENVLILAIGYSRCLLKTTQVIEGCQNYLIYSQGIYVCDECKQNYSLKAGVGRNICVRNTNIENNCLQYRDNGAEEQCSKCQTGFTVSHVNITANPDKLRKKCLSNSLEVIKGCKIYQLGSDGKYECTDCNTGFTKSDVKIESSTQVRCLPSTESVQDCSIYIVNQANLYLCDGCSSGYTLENSTMNKVCVKSDYIQDHCIKYKDNGAIEQCIKCEANYTLSVVFSGQSQSSQCLETRTKLITGCKTYEFLSSQELQCKECDTAHSLQPVYETQTKFSQKCIANEDVVPECLGYAQVGMSCSHDCNICSSEFKLAVVKVRHRITNGCLSKTTEYLPFCLLHAIEQGAYYCRHGVCEKGSFSVFIGPGQTQKACTSDSLIEFVDDENCLYFERPKFGTTELKCQKCKDGFSEPHCKPIDGYQGLTSGN